MDNTISFSIPALSTMKRYPEKLYYRGDLSLLKRPKISIIGTRRPNQYSRAMTLELSRKLSLSGMVIVSGAAMGIDAYAHQGAGEANTIAILPCGIDVRYPVSNTELIKSIETNGLTVSQFECGFNAREWSFVIRNEMVVALGDALIVMEADSGSGSMRSVDYALEMGKTIYVLPHRINESAATRQLVAEGKAIAIDNIDRFVAEITQKGKNALEDSPLIAYCRSNPTYEDALVRYPREIFEAELKGLIEVRNGRVWVI